MPRYIEVVAAARETATKILALRNGTRRRVKVTTDGGHTASVDWDDRSVTLNMPTLPPDAMLTRAEADRLVAFILHEACHVIWSDRAAWARAVGDGSRVQAWTNSLEDVRIEQAEIAAGMFPAARGLLSTIANHLHGEALQDAPRGYAIGAQVADAPYVACILGRVANGYAIPSAHGLAAAMSEDVSRLLTVALQGVAGCTSTEDVRQLAGRLVRMEGQPKQPRQPKQPPKGDDASEGSQGAQEGQEGADGSQDQGNGSQGSESAQGDPEASKSKQDGGGAAPAGRSGGGKGKAPSTDASLSKTVAAIAGRNNAQVGNGYSHVLSVAQVSDTRNDIANSKSHPPSFDAADNAAAAKVMNDLLPRNAVLAGQIGRMLVSEETRRVTHRESAGRLDRRALTRMRTGALDVFSRREDTPGVDTAVLLLIDGSGSMQSATGATGNGPSRTALAVTTAWHVAKAAELAGARVAVGVFYGSGMRAQVQVLKDWNEPAKDAAAAIRSACAATSTPLSVSVLHGARMLDRVPGATRRILMAITDGGCDLGSDTVRAACVLAEDLYEVETVGIGMNCSSVVHSFPPRYSVDVVDLDQLAAAGLGALVRMLEDAA